MSCACITEPTRQPPRIPPGRVLPAWPDVDPNQIEPKDAAVPLTPLQLIVAGGATLGLLYLVCRA